MSVWTWRFKSSPAHKKKCPDESGQGKTGVPAGQNNRCSIARGMFARNTNGTTHFGFLLTKIKRLLMTPPELVGGISNIASMFA